MTVDANVDACERDWSEPPAIIREQPRRLRFSIDGYLARNLALDFETPSGTRERHCIQVAWPAGNRNRDGQPCSVATTVDEAWFRALSNTLLRVPAHHARIVQRIIIDNRPREHGIAPHDRARADDARDGRSLWLHEHVFRAPNHWARGNYGSYWSYHVDRDGPRVDGSPADHAFYSPVILHELGHLVMYHLVNAAFKGPAATSAPGCADACSGSQTRCARSAPAELEAGCVTPYCRSFQFEARTENWAEQYRFYYQSQAARAALTRSGGTCQKLLQQIG
ncbi:MAG TPA: hypothetical protein VK524_25025, partial [Polyangiaceae bacterium]|nr:hypothetical protein [Polyangiaceae bacterium]